MRFKYFFISLFLLCIVSGALADKAVVEDFSDVGTWRKRWRKGTTPGTWFSVSQCLSGAKNSQRPDGHAGVIEFDFSGKPPYQLGFMRYKPYTKASVFADTISFSADRNGRDVKMAFIIEDANHKNFYTKSIKLTGKGWNDYVFPLNSNTVGNFDKMELPVRIKRVDARFARPGRGEIYIDDIAFLGDVSKKQRYTIQPVYRGIATLPGKTVLREYLIRNGSKKKADVSVMLAVYNFDDKKVFSKSKQLTLAPLGCENIKFQVGKLPIGAYYTKASVSYKKIKNTFEGWFGVYRPNNKRINLKPMYFGVQDTTSWNGFYENELHLTWLKALGIDIVRYGTTGGRFQPTENINGFSHFDEQLKPLMDANILVCMSYCEGIPKWLQNPPYHYRRMADKQDKLAKHIESIAKYMKKYPNIQYFEWWNEPDISFLRDNIDNYLKNLKTVYTSIKKVNPSVKVITGGATIKHPRQKKNFSRDMYQKGKGYYDVANFHAHGSLSMYIERNNMVEEWLKEKNIDLPVSNTETGSRSGYEVKSIKHHAETVVHKLTFAKSRNTEFYIWFTLQDYWDMDANADDSFGLVTCDNQPKPSFIAYNNLIKQLANTIPVAPLDIDKRLVSYRFKRNDGNEVFVCWPKLTGEKVLLTVNSAKPVKFSDIFGKETVIKPKFGKVSVSNTSLPFYLVAPSGCIKPGVPVVKVLSAQGGAPGSVCNLKAEILNPFKHDVDITISGKDVVKNVNLKLKHGQKILTQVPVKINRKTFGMYNTVINVKMESGSALDKLSVPASVNAAYLIVKEGEKPDVINVKDNTKVHELTFDPSIPRWMGVKDLSCKAWATHNKKGIQFTFDVTDDKHFAKHKGVNIWRGDSIQLGIKPLEGKHTEITIADSPEGATVWCHSSAEYVGQWNVPVSVEHKNGHTVYKVFVPFSKLGMKYSPGKLIRMAFLVNEDDGLGRIRWVEWFKGIGTSKDSSKYGWTILK